MARVRRQIARVAPTESTVLLLGETGTGKGLAARELHAASPRAGGPFVHVDCAALSASLVESELFGHERGAFTGAVAPRLGRFELARGGTLFLDEIGELELPLQGKLLRALQERRFERLGGTRTLSLEARVVAATHRDLREAVRAGRFRRDLWFRLCVFTIELPPLRERPADLVRAGARGAARPRAASRGDARTCRARVRGGARAPRLAGERSRAAPHPRASAAARRGAGPRRRARARRARRGEPRGRGPGRGAGAGALRPPDREPLPWRATPPASASPQCCARPAATSRARRGASASRAARCAGRCSATGSRG